MTDYRLYFFDPAGGIRQVHELTCPEDAEAIRLAEQEQGAAPMELWSLDRLVRRFPANDWTPAAPPRAATGR